MAKDIKKTLEALENRVTKLENAYNTLNREMGEVKGQLEGIKKVEENNNFWLKVLAIGTPASIIFSIALLHF